MAYNYLIDLKFVPENLQDVVILRKAIFEQVEASGENGLTIKQLQDFLAGTGLIHFKAANAASQKRQLTRYLTEMKKQGLIDLKTKDGKVKQMLVTLKQK